MGRSDRIILQDVMKEIDCNAQFGESTSQRLKFLDLNRVFGRQFPHRHVELLDEMGIKPFLQEPDLFHQLKVYHSASLGSLGFA